uniref:Putative secreted protein n=1 Tax=Panstrongylus lignarius TaxID=156445 RepID=A0A224Y1A0_9HEMI
MDIHCCYLLQPRMLGLLIFLSRPKLAQLLRTWKERLLLISITKEDKCAGQIPDWEPYSVCPTMELMSDLKEMLYQTAYFYRMVWPAIGSLVNYIGLMVRQIELR